MEGKEIDPYYQRQARELVDMIFNKNYFGDDIKREELQDIEDFIAYALDNGVKSGIKLNEILKRKPENDQR